ncbi:4'-phosphopantetheinyl transferase family protein [Hymenobacter bucti]|uniref:4'-phosphopantetheinyl transferase family protein n=1 Tax=Hymenobacter bucti TaxID=1844114 RepID=A0ABW4QQV2_9BACT
MLLTCSTRPAGERWSAHPDFRWPAAVAVFRLPVAASQSFAPQAAALLQADELRRAHRYHRPADYHRFLLGRAAQRLVLGAYLGLPPAGLHFELGADKKPRLREAPLHYNVSHAGDWVLLAMAGAEVGVDVERLDSQFAFEELLDYSFSPPEKAFIERSPVPHHAFYQLWTRKEAFVKATGRGIDAEFSQVPALVGEHRLADFGPVPGWAVSSFEVAAGYAAAVAHPAPLAGALHFYDLGGAVLGELYAAARR